MHFAFFCCRVVCPPLAERDYFEHIGRLTDPHLMIYGRSSRREIDPWSCLIRMAHVGAVCIRAKYLQQHTLPGVGPCAVFQIFGKI